MAYLSTFISAKLFLLLAVSPSYNQQKNGAMQDRPIPITKISYSTTGGRGGNTVSLEITSKTLVYVVGRGGAEKTVTEKTSKSLWNSFTKAINTNDMDGIKSNPVHALYDGTDITITVEKGKEIHTLVNGNEDSLKYKKIKAFTDILESQLSRLEKKIR